MMIDWDKLWEDFDAWIEDTDDDGWDSQKHRIEMLVEEQLSLMKIDFKS